MPVTDAFRFRLPIGTLSGGCNFLAIENRIEAGGFYFFFFRGGGLRNENQSWFYVDEDSE
jgi:hypothetical protein